MPHPKSCDLSIVSYGLLAVITPITARGRWLLRTKVETFDFQWEGDVLMVESRYLKDIVGALSPHCALESRRESGISVRKLKVAKATDSNR